MAFVIAAPHRKGVEMIGTLEERFWDKVAFLGAGLDECWEWTASRLPWGYGVIGRGRKDGKSRLAHRVSWELENGPIPEGMCVLHHCDNPGCVNPSHLFLGTNMDNTQDMISKGREADRRGAKNPTAKLTRQDVYEIRQMLQQQIYQRVIAMKYGIARSTVSHIKTGRDWSRPAQK